MILRLTRLEWFEDGRGLTQDDTPLQSRHAAAHGQSFMNGGGQLTREKAETLKLESGNWAERRASRATVISRFEVYRRPAETTADEHALLHKRCRE